MPASHDPVEAISQRLDNFVTGQRAVTADLGAEAALLVEAAAAMNLAASAPASVTLSRCAEMNMSTR